MARDGGRGRWSNAVKDRFQHSVRGFLHVDGAAGTLRFTVGYALLCNPRLGILIKPLHLHDLLPPAYCAKAELGRAAPTVSQDALS